jgi:hypothetical protein
MATAPGKLENKGGDKPKYNPRSQTPKGQRRTQNPCILSDGSVDPKCKTYQRSVAGREKLEDFVKRLDSQGVEEKDIFMAAVKSLTNRGHGYVGAYLDSKNPNRRYEENQAQAIADSVMTKAGVGSHPGARLTKEEEGTKEARAEKRASAGPSEPGKKAMSVRQQRKQPGGRGKDAMGMPETWAKSGRGVDENTVRQRREDGQPEVEPGELKSDVDVDKDKGTKGSKPEVKAPPIPKPTPKGPTGVDPTSPVQKRIKELSKPPEPTSEQQEEIDKIMAAKDDMDPEEWAKSLEEMFALVKAGPGRQRQELRDYMDRLKGKGKREAAPLPGTAAGVKREEDVARGLEKKKAEQEKLQAAAQAGKGRAAEERRLAQEREEDKRIEEEIPIDEDIDELPKAVDSLAVGDKFRELFRDNIKAGLSVDPESLIEETTDILNDEGNNLTTDQVGWMVSNRFGRRGIDGRRIPFKQYPDPSQQQPAEDSPTEEETTSPIKEERVESPQEEVATQAPTPRPPEERLGTARARSSGRAKPSGFKPVPGETKMEVKDSLAKAASQNLTPQQVVEEYKQGTLFPGGLVTETSATNPLEGGTTAQPEQGPESTKGPEELGGDLFAKGNQPPEARRESARQMPLPLGRGNSQAQLAARAGVEQRRIEKEAKKLGKRPPKPRKGKAPIQQSLFTPKGNPKKFNTSEMSYDEFSQNIRSLMR